jgi:hypothetical protein
MKKTMLLITCIATTGAYGMNEINADNTQPFSIEYCGTIINLNKGSQLNADVDCMVTGKHQQRLFNDNKMCGDYKAGKIKYKNNYRFYENSFNSLNKFNNNPYLENPIIKQYPCIQSKIMTCPTMIVTEPCIWHKENYLNANDWCAIKEKKQNKPLYWTLRPYHQETENHAEINYEFYGEQAIKEASIDLSLCYTKILCEKFIINKINKVGYHNPPAKMESIGIPALGTDTGFDKKIAAPITVLTILRFIKNYPSEYKRIELFVKEDFEFNLYKELLQPYDK